MYLYFFLIFYLYLFTIEALPDYDELDYSNDNPPPVFLNRDSKKQYPAQKKPCDRLPKTQKSPYVVFMLYTSSGYFMGMGSIIDKKTVITALHAVMSSINAPHNILVLAGCRSPWWSEGAQVRKVKKLMTNEYELVLVEVSEVFKFNKRVAPIALMEVLEDNWYAGYGTLVGIYGIASDEYSAPGNKVTKAIAYYFAVSTWMMSYSCYRHYLDISPHFNHTQHVCIHNNGTFCSGCVGSPVIGVTNHEQKRELIGVVLRSICIDPSTPSIAIKLSEFDLWIRSNSLLGFLIKDRN